MNRKQIRINRSGMNQWLSPKNKMGILFNHFAKKEYDEEIRVSWQVLVRRYRAWHYSRSGAPCQWMYPESRDSCGCNGSAAGSETTPDTTNAMGGMGILARPTTAVQPIQNRVIQPTVSFRPPSCSGTLKPCGGSCIDFTSDPDNCGTCGKVCSDYPNMNRTCSGGTCSYSCFKKYGYLYRGLQQEYGRRVRGQPLQRYQQLRKLRKSLWKRIDLFSGCL